VFNSQSETITEAYGEYFITELIASQNEGNKAQVKDKAIGLMGLTKEVDLKLLHKCFELDSFNNLLKRSSWTHSQVAANFWPRSCSATQPMSFLTA
jgi:hypothetical protein